MKVLQGYEVRSAHLEVFQLFFFYNHPLNFDPQKFALTPSFQTRGLVDLKKESQKTLISFTKNQLNKYKY